LPQNASLPAATYYSYSFQQKNALNLKANGIDASIGFTFDTGLGTFSSGLNWAEKLKMDQQVGSGGKWFSVLNTSGFNTTFPSIKRTASLDLGWRRNEFNANVKVNYTAGYKNWSGSANTGNAAWTLISAAGVPSGGGQPIPAYTTANLHLGYNSAATDGMLKDLGVSLDVQNVFDKAPPFFNSANGYDGNAGNPIGRVASLGVSKKW
jgi:iron complex outermembrane receptor protein